VARLRADLHQVRDGFDRFGLLDARVRFLQGEFGDSLKAPPIERLALLRVGGGVGASVTTILERLHPLVAPKGIVIVEGTSDPSVEQAVQEVRGRLPSAGALERADWNAVWWQVGPEPVTASPTPAGSPSTVTSAPPRRVPLAPPVPADAAALSVVAVMYNMRREAARTLLSLTRGYQRGIDGLDYEVIVVENGSDPDQRLGADFVRSFGENFRYVSMGCDAPPSPTAALNRGIAEARGQAIALMIDGAHLLTPGVLGLGMTALETYEPAIVATQQWYVGPGQQGDALHAGYDQDAEDRLFAGIHWPVDGYRLFEIGHFIGERDWFDGIVESNCLFVPRSLLEQAGGLDDSFSMPGGGYANLDLFERLGFTPGVRVASLLGEATFHQVHGGTTTNVADPTDRRGLVFSYGEHFRALRGRQLEGLTEPVYFLGAMATKAARRTRSRREIKLGFDPLRDPVGPGTTPAVAAPVPDELKLAAVEAVWSNLAWKEATWLGHTVGRFPTDMYCYQELLSRVRPAVVVVAGDDDDLGGRALFAASVCDLLGTGTVVAVGAQPLERRPRHDRIVDIVGPPEEQGVAAQVAGCAGSPPAAMVFIGLGAQSRVTAAFERYAPLVPVGSYVVVENTIVNGRPVASAFGPGPFEAVVDILGRHPDFVADPGPERYAITFNRSGYLKRVSDP
jgi:cephalosporin hydroxylase